MARSDLRPGDVVYPNFPAGPGELKRRPALILDVAGNEALLAAITTKWNRTPERARDFAITE